MTDYAKPDSLPFRAHYFQQRRKKRKAANALELAVTHQSQPITYNSQLVIHSGE